MTIKELKEKYPKSYLAHDRAVIYLADNTGTRGELNLERVWIYNPDKEADLEKYITWTK